MPASTADRRILIFTTCVVVLAGVLVAAALFVVTGGGGETPETKPLFVGLEKQLVENLEEEGPQYIANPFGGKGFWLDTEDGHVVVYSLILPTTKSSAVKWKAQRDTYADCNGDAVAKSDLDQYKVTTRHDEGERVEVFVDLRVLIPAAGTDGGG